MSKRFTFHFPSRRPRTHVEVERIAERFYDELDSAYLSTSMTSDEYDAWGEAFADWERANSVVRKPHLDHAVFA